jgi:hypothetical protein
MLLSRENQRGNQEWIVQKHWQQSALKTQDEDKESNKTIPKPTSNPGAREEKSASYKTPGVTRCVTHIYSMSSH